MMVSSVTSYRSAWTAFAAALAIATGSFGAGGKIVFESDRDGDFEIFVMDEDGSNQTQLTVNTASDREPSWSAGGARSPSSRTGTATPRST
jgi:hypothetical protein